MSTKPVAVLLACALLPYLGTLGHDFVDYDDPSTIVGLPAIRELGLVQIARLFRPDIYPGLPEYMPLKNASYAVDYALFGPWAPGFRPQQLFWYAASVIALWLWLRVLLASLERSGRLGLPAGSAERLAWITAALFALHPVHVESVTWLSGRKDVLSGAFMLAALYCAARWQPARGPGFLLGAVACSALALLSKPMAVVLPGLALLADVVCREPGQPLLARVRERWRLHAALGVSAVAFAAFYYSVVAVQAQAKAVDAWRIFAGPGYARVGQQLAQYATLALAPTELSPIYPPELLDPAPLSLRALFGYALLAGLLWALARAVARRHPLALALGLFAIPLVPVIAAPAWGQYLAARYLYLAVAGVLLALVWAGMALVARRPNLRFPARAASGLFVLLLLVSTLDYNRKWSDSLALWTGALEVYPRFTALHHKAASAALRAGQRELATDLLRGCLEVAPGEAGCSGLLGRLLLREDPAEGERMLRAALPRDLTGAAHQALAKHLLATGRGREGYELYRRFLTGRAPAMEQIEALAWLALGAGATEQGFFYARETVRAGAMNHPAGPPPRALLQELARLPAAGPARSAALSAALARCDRVDCTKQVLGW